MTHVIESAHSDLGPSSGDRWTNCTGSVLAARGRPDRASKYAAEGTVAHEVSLWVREQRTPATTFIGQSLTSDGFTFRVNKAMALAVQQFCDWCAEVPGDPYYEIKVAYERFVPGGFGTADDIRIADGVCVVTDLKFGTGHRVHAKKNAQLMLYALGVYETYGWLYRFKDFNLRIAQPRLQHWDEWATTLDEILWWAIETAQPAAIRALKPGAPFAAGSWCSFCRLRDDCAVRAQYRRERQTAERITDFEDLEAPV